MIEAPYNFLSVALHPTENLVKTQVITAITDTSNSRLFIDMFARSLLVLLLQLRPYLAHMSINEIKRPKTKMEREKERKDFGICMDGETLWRIEQAKGEYMSRGKYILKAVHKMLEEDERRQKKTTKVSASAEEAAIPAK